MKRIALVLLALPALVLWHGAPAEAAHRTTTPDLRVFTSNIGSGAECTSGCLDVVEQQIAAWHPDAVTLVEVCASDVRQFTADHPDWDVFFRPMIQSLPGCNDEAKGDLVAAPTLERTTVIDLPGDLGPRDFGVPCGDVGTTWVCAVHLAAVFSTDESNQTKAAQVRALADATDGWSKVALGGDYNTRPGNDTVWAAFDNRGYVETDRADNQPTHGLDPANRTAKFDHVWYHKATGGSPASVNGVVISQPTSHHDLLRGTVTW